VAQSSSNGRLLEDAHWLLAKGELMLSDLQSANDELRIVVRMNGSRRDEAADMIETLQTVHNDR
jgi:hypothetical protein